MGEVSERIGVFWKERKTGDKEENGGEEENDDDDEEDKEEERFRGAGDVGMEGG